ncbi:hypothetical protein C8R43DRAFT_1009820 [Mycena crocata]|nr:hypothetical protein C8R43DRAFT_1009820 [Mycena crocata]
MPWPGYVFEGARCGKTDVYAVIIRNAQIIVACKLRPNTHTHDGILSWTRKKSSYSTRIARIPWMVPRKLPKNSIIHGQLTRRLERNNQCLVPDRKEEPDGANKSLPLAKLFVNAMTESTVKRELPRSFDAFNVYKGDGIHLIVYSGEGAGKPHHSTSSWRCTTEFGFDSRVQCSRETRSDGHGTVDFRHDRFEAKERETHSHKRCNKVKFLSARLRAETQTQVLKRLVSRDQQR